MQTILIFNNEELFKVLMQAKNLLPDCEIKHIENKTNDMLDDVGVFIADTGIINKLKKELGGIKLRIIGLGSGNDLQSSEGVILIKKPYMLKEVIDIINNTVAAIANNRNNLRIGNFEYDSSSRALIKDNVEIILTEKEAELIMLLYKAGNNIVSREEILREVWGYENDVDTHTIETHIYRIRQKLGKQDNFIGNSAAGYFIS